MTACNSSSSSGSGSSDSSHEYTKLPRKHNTVNHQYADAAVNISKVSSTRCDGGDRRDTAKVGKENPS